MEHEEMGDDDEIDSIRIRKRKIRRSKRKSKEEYGMEGRRG
jgi:hypothetical protein